MVVKVAVSAATFAIDKPYDYLLPKPLCADARPGMRVLVPFGRSNKKTEAIILSVTADTQTKRPKAVLRLLDKEQLLDEKAVNLALWMHERFFCTVFEALRSMLPSGLWNVMEPIYFVSDEAGAKQALNDHVSDEKAYKVLLALIEAKSGLTLSKITELTAPDDPIKTLKKLEKASLIKSETLSARAVSDKFEKIAQLVVSDDEASDYAREKRKSAPMQASVMDFIIGNGSASVKDICYFTGASPASVQALEKKGLIRFELIQAYRRPVIKETASQGETTLNEDQISAFQGLAEMIDVGKAAAALLFGVTGSGKTQVYIKLIEYVIEHGGQAIVLVPEISLTPQLAELFHSRFGNRLAILHSALSYGERSDEWKRVRLGEVSVAIGTRSAVFAPFDNLKLIILDEEQEYTYKSENSPRYHARDVAKFRCVQHEALLLLGSATPSVETMYNAKAGVYSLFEINRRYNMRELPQFQIADMRKELINGNGSTISGMLYHALKKNINDEKQSILFINRRGNSRLTACVGCGYVEYCPRCSVALVFHSANGRLMCHHCGYSEKLPEQCPECGGKFKMIGAGTQKVAEELSLLFPDIKILRMDTDSTASKNSHESILERFKEEKIPILVGTQMVAKGLDIENVTLVGVIAADHCLYSDDYRASERTFSLITQVLGRAGRGAHEGSAVIQTFTPENPVILTAARQDYMKFYENEIKLRQAQGMPPFSDLFVLTVFGSQETEVLKACKRLKDTLNACLEDEEFSRIGAKVLGPAPAPVVKLNNSYRYRLTLCSKSSKYVRNLIARLLIGFANDKRNRSLHLFADVNPE